MGSNCVEIFISMYNILEKATVLSFTGLGKMIYWSLLSRRIVEKSVISDNDNMDNINVKNNDVAKNLSGMIITNDKNMSPIREKIKN